ncbi:hypothetical protein P280DRAFT_286812 [Massarina eburnea CBS 473.64]|uniref:C2H2-type domain-containing protein n=1 Tax=Massarina eburnea CBS 473.64 TaxID=1395130 RepID=A0A6A6S401_9PLEO|nr:hypothetical protein P280DRAFT_286812 [Massarina eburnea CBS 473.64]
MMREVTEEHSRVYIRSEVLTDEPISNAEWNSKVPSFDVSSLVPETFDSWAVPTSKYQRSFGIPPTSRPTSNEGKTERALQDASKYMDATTNRFRLPTPTPPQNASLRKYRLSRSPLDSLQEEFKRYGSLETKGTLAICPEDGSEDKDDASLDTLDWSFIQKKFELPEHPKISDCPSLATGSTISSRNSSTRSTKSGKGEGSEQPEKGVCPIPECGRMMRDLAAHLLTHQAERPEKCPVDTCEYHTKGFARTYDKVRHTLKHFKGKFICDFCPTSGSVSERTFLRCDIFLRHLVSAHGVQQTPPARREELYHTGVIKQPRRRLGNQTVATCTLCSEPFDVQGFYEHLRGCVLRQVTRSYPTLQSFARVTPTDQQDESKGSLPDNSTVAPTDDITSVPQNAPGHGLETSSTTIRSTLVSYNLFAVSVSDFVSWRWGRNEVFV